jgi:hypothetical protein
MAQRSFFQYLQDILCRHLIPSKKVNTYIVIQMIVSSESRNKNGITHLMNTIVRKVEADTKELAIGKFVVATKDIAAINKLDIDCYDLNELISL